MMHRPKGMKTVDYHLKRLRWSMQKNNNEWLRACEMYELIQEHKIDEVNRQYCKDVGAKNTAPPTLRYLPPKTALVFHLKRSGEYDYDDTQCKVRVYRLKEALA